MKNKYMNTAFIQVTRVYEAYALSVKRPITVVSVRTIALRLPSVRRRSLPVPSARRALAKQASDWRIFPAHQGAVAAALRLRVVRAVASAGEAVLGGSAEGMGSVTLYGVRGG